MSELECWVGGNDFSDIGPCSIKEPICQVNLYSSLDRLIYFTEYMSDVRDTSLVKFSTVPGCTNPKLSFHPWNRAELLYTGPATGWNNEATVSKYGENADGAGYCVFSSIVSICIGYV